MLFGIIKTTFKEFMDDGCPTLAAALAFYTVFSLPPLLFAIVAVIGQVFDRGTIEKALQHQASSLTGMDMSTAIAEMIQNASKETSGAGFAALAVGLIGVLVGATAAFSQLQSALNRAWEVEAKPEGFLSYIVKRVLSFGLVLGIGFLVLMSLAVNTWVAAMGEMLHVPKWVVQGLSFLISFVIVAGMFATMFKFLPDAEVDWRDVRVGALVTAALLEIGKIGIGLYLGREGTVSAFGAAGSLAMLLLFIYYSAMLVLLGAEFTQVWAIEHGKEIRPTAGAERIPDNA